MRILILTIFLAVLPVAGCSWTKFNDGAKFDKAKLASITEGSTNFFEVLRLLGAPKAISYTGNGPVLIYNYTLQKSFGLSLLVVNFGNAERQSDTVMIFFDKKQIVQAISCDDSAHLAEYRLPFSR